ncbi:hypothetical protein [Tenacibaculum halocynthiae]|uniref:hypothetical protein n=1 Tax=Tenacibaculum halocynthiae TaxID=1254437 RepID=UPI003D6489FE
MRFILYIFILLLISCKNNKKIKLVPYNQTSKISWINKPTSVYASENIHFTFKTDTINSGILLFINNDYGSSILQPQAKNNQLTFIIPKHFSTISGILNYTVVINKKEVITDKLIIKPQTATTLLETYCGPPYIVASKTDYSMLVVIPNDIYDNPNCSDYTAYELYRDTPLNTRINTTELLSYKNIYSKTKTGKIFVRTYIDSLKSKLLELSILSNNPTNFSISFDRNNSFADGKELTTFKTSVIKDQFNNIIENGTIVSFYISNDDTHLKAYGKTNNGIAVTKFVHPEKIKSFNIKAYVEGFASSNSLNIKYTKKID